MDTVVLGISGSLRKDSVSTKLLRAFGERAPKNIDFRIADISRLPIYNQDLELPEPDYLLDWKRQIEPAKGILIVTPEYNRSIPPVLKNALDWASRPQMPPGRGYSYSRLHALYPRGFWRGASSAAGFNIFKHARFTASGVLFKPGRRKIRRERKTNRPNDY